MIEKIQIAESGLTINCDPKMNIFAGTKIRGVFRLFLGPCDPAPFSVTRMDLEEDYQCYCSGEALFDPEPPSYPWIEDLSARIELQKVNLVTFDWDDKLLEYLRAVIPGFQTVSQVFGDQPILSIQPVLSSQHIEHTYQARLPGKIFQCLLTTDLSKKLHLALSLYHLAKLSCPQAHGICWLDDFDAYLEPTEALRFLVDLSGQFPNIQFMVGFPSYNRAALNNFRESQWRTIGIGTV